MTKALLALLMIASVSTATFADTPAEETTTEKKDETKTEKKNEAENPSPAAN